MSRKANVSLEEATLALRPFEGNEWRFQFPRLSLEIHERLDCAIDLWHAGEILKAENMFRLLIFEYPEFIDAYHHLAMLLEETGRNQEAFRTWQEAVHLTTDYFIESFCAERKLLPWAVLDHRPFLRAYHGLGLQYLKRGDVKRALPIFKNILRLSPNDNQGVRALVIECYFHLKCPQDVLEVCKEYPDDTMVAPR